MQVRILVGIGYETIKFTQLLLTYLCFLLKSEQSTRHFVQMNDIIYSSWD